MENLFDKILNFHKTKGGTGKLFKFKYLDYSPGFLKLEAEFSKQTLNPNKSVQGGMMTSMLDDITSLLVIYESKGTIYPSSTNLHSIHHRPLFAGKVVASAKVISMGKNIATVKGMLYNSENKIATSLVHTMFLIKTDFNINSRNK